VYQLVLVIHIIAAICVIGLVLLQQGKGAVMGAAFGSGASQTVFGSRGSGSFLLKLTALFIIIFFSTSITLNYMMSQAVRQSNAIVLPGLPATTPATTTSGSVPSSTPVSPSNIPMGK
jgi:preprotein translocase subunit SecG